MSIARGLARKFFGKSIEILDLQIAFYKEAILYGSHGILIASHKDKGLVNDHVRFVFIGLTAPPTMTPRVIDYIWEEAKAQGYLPSGIASYGSILPLHVNIPPRALISAERRAAEDANYDRKPSPVEAGIRDITPVGGFHAENVTVLSNNSTQRTR